VDHSKTSSLSREKPFAYPQVAFTPLAKKAKYRELFAEHFQKSRDEIKRWKPLVDVRLERENQKV